jgi:VWFA-related protein
LIAPIETLAQSQIITGDASRNPGKPVVIPMTVQIKEAQQDPELQGVDLTVSEDGEPQAIISIRSRGNNAPIHLIVLIQDDLVPSISNEIKSLASFVRELPKGSRVMIGYIRTGTLQVRQKFTNDLDRAAKSLRAPAGFASAAPYNPYVEVIEALKRFDAQPLGRRAVLLISDGLDVSRGVDSSTPTQSTDLQRAIAESQKRAVAVYSFYAPTIGAERNLILSGNAQSSLKRLGDETGGEAFFQGMGVPVSFDPFIKQLNQKLERQAALTFLSTHLNKGFHRIEVKSSTPGVKVTVPSGYVR